MEAGSKNRSNIQLYNIDCMEYMKTCKDKQFDLAIVDPPYGIGAAAMTMGKGSRNSSGKNKRKQWDSKTPKKEYFNELIRISTNQIIWGGNYFLDFLSSTRCFLLWDKLDYNSDFASHELAWTSFNKNVKCFRKSRNKGYEIKIHPTQKPIALYKWLLKNYAKESDTILDTHLGSGSIAIACDDLGFDLVGCELDKEYYDNAVKRLEKHRSQLKMW